MMKIGIATLIILSATKVNSVDLLKETSLKFVGCFKDSLNSRDLPFEFNGNVADSIDACVQECLSHFFRYDHGHNFPNKCSYIVDVLLIVAINMFCPLF